MGGIGIGVHENPRTVSDLLIFFGLDLLFAGRVAGDEDLLRVAVGVLRIDLEPTIECVAAVLGVRAFARPFGIAQCLEQFRGRTAR